MKTYHFLISGKVQGVGFRFFTQEKAFVCNISGWVRNLNDGRVEILLQGKKQNIESFLNAIKEGPNSFSKVTDIESKELELNETLGEFEILGNGEVEWSN